MARIQIDREAMTQTAFEKKYNLPSDIVVRRPAGERLRGWFRRKCSLENIEQSVLDSLPVIEIIRGYQWRKWIARDLVAGLSIGAIHIPQGMGFALLAEIPAVYGLYASFWPPLFYFLFGTSRHISMGTMALMSVMLSAVVTKETALAGFSLQDDSEEAVHFKVGIVMSVSLMMGCFLVMMSYLRLGILATYMSMPFVRSFMTAAGVNIIVGQAPILFQLKLPPLATLFKTPRLIYEIFAHIKETNVPTFVIGLICLVLLYVVKEIVNPRVIKKLKVPIPAELFVVILGTLISHFGQFNQRWNVKVIGDIPLGFPAPRTPPMTNAGSYVLDSFMIAVVSFALSITMAKMLARKHEYTIDTNQELFAYGLSYGLSAFFLGFCGAQAPPRSVVQDSAGGKTQLSGVFSSILVLLVSLVLGRYFSDLPNVILAAIVIVALLPLVKSFTDLRQLWKGNKLDFITWVLTAFCVVFLDITAGLIAGMAFSVLSVTFQALHATGSVMSEIADTGLYTSVQDSEHIKAHPGVKIFRFNSALYFVNIETFRQHLFKYTFNPKAKEKFSIIKMLSKSVGSMISAMTINNDVFDGDIEATEAKKSKLKLNPQQIHTIIIDCMRISYIDIMGLNLFSELQKDYATTDVKVVLAGCSHVLINKLLAIDIVHEDGTSSMEIYPSVHDAVMAATNL